MIFKSLPWMSLLMSLWMSFSLAFPSAADPRHVSTNFVRMEKARPSDQMHLLIALKRDPVAVNKAISFVEDVSDPESPIYGQYWSHDEAILPLVPGAKERIENMLRQMKATVDWSRDPAWVVAFAQVQDVERVLGVDVHRFQHKRSGRVVLRSLKVAQFDGMHHDVDMILGLSDFLDSVNERSDSPKGIAKNVSKGAARSSAPEFLPTRGNEELLQVTLALFDLDGAPLSRFGGRLHVNMTSDVGDVQIRTVPIDSNFCQNQGSIMCSVDIPVSPFAKTRMSAQAVFAQGSTDIGMNIVNSTAAGWVTPNVAFKQYGVPKGTKTSGRSTCAVSGFEEQYIDLDDVEQFYQINGLEFDRSLFTIVGPNDPSKPGGESMLDITWISAMAPGAPTSFLSFCGPAGPAKGPCGAYIATWAAWVGNTTDPPFVTSHSYGDTEKGYFNKFGNNNYVYRVEQELMIMAGRGLTVVAGSGDAGASNVGEAGNDISPTDPTCSPTRPFFPSMSRYVVSLSSSLLSTHITPFCNSVSPGDPRQAGVSRPSGVAHCDVVGEAFVNMGTSGTYWSSGGGFSSLIKRPSFQDDAVAHYFAANADRAFPNENTWDRSGRAYADLTTLGYNLNIVINGKVGATGGTSASGPLLAGLLTLLNDIQIQAGRSRLGSPHKWIYNVLSKVPGAFNPMMDGRNDDGDWQSRTSSYPSFCPNAGFPIGRGPFSAASGWGSPNIDVWAAHLPK